MNPIFKEIYNAHYAKVYRLCKGYVGGDEALAQDLTQDAFVKVYTYLSTFKGEASISTWIYRIAVNTCLLYLRKAKKHNTQPLSVDIALDSQESAIDKEAQLASLYRCIDTLRNDDKAIILLTLDKVPQKEIAAIIGISHETVRVRMHRIKKQLITCIQDGHI